MPAVFPKDLYEIRRITKGFIYWDAKKYDLAINHYEKVLEILAPADSPAKFFHNAFMLITCYRSIKQFGPAMKWAKTALNNLNNTNSSFYEKLSILGAYSDLINEAGISFDEKYTAFIDKLVQELEFPPIPDVEPIDRIKIIIQENKKWNQQLMKIQLIGMENKDELISALKDYIASCEIGWYKNYAEQTLRNMEKAC